jgi:hypothetical protein
MSRGSRKSGNISYQYRKRPTGLRQDPAERQISRQNRSKKVKNSPTEKDHDSSLQVG